MKSTTFRSEKDTLIKTVVRCWKLPSVNAGFPWSRAITDILRECCGHVKNDTDERTCSTRSSLFSRSIGQFGGIHISKNPGVWSHTCVSTVVEARNIRTSTSKRRHRLRQVIAAPNCTPPIPLDRDGAHVAAGGQC